MQLSRQEIEQFIDRALAEDIGRGDLTTNVTIAEGTQLKVSMMSRQDVVVCGLEAARRGKLLLAIAAPDASSNSLNKVLPLLRAREIPVFSAPSAKELGNAVGRDSTAVVGIVDRGLAKGIRALSLSAMTVGSKEELG